MKKQTMLLDYLKIADIHAARLKDALAHFTRLMPLTAEMLVKLSSDQVAFLDMMTMRFGKLQDIIGVKIFSLVLDLLGEDVNSFIDKLNKLERLGYIDNVNWWMDLREIRNQIMHDYPNDYEAVALHLAMLGKKANELLLFWDGLKNKIDAFLNG